MAFDPRVEMAQVVYSSRGIWPASNSSFLSSRVEREDEGAFFGRSFEREDSKSKSSRTLPMSKRKLAMG